MTKVKLSPEAKKAKNAYQKKWRQRNPDKVARYVSRHWEKKARGEGN